MQITAELKKIKGNAEVERIKRMEQSIEKILNYDGRWAVCHPMKGLLRLTQLTNAESDYLGRKMGWDIPYYGGVDWDKVPTNFLAACAASPDGMDWLRLLYPAPAQEASDRTESTATDRIGGHDR